MTLFCKPFLSLPACLLFSPKHWRASFILSQGHCFEMLQCPVPFRHRPGTRACEFFHLKPSLVCQAYTSQQSVSILEPAANSPPLEVFPADL